MKDTMKLLTKLKVTAKQLKQELTALYYAYRYPEVGAASKIVIAVTLGYALSPIDLIPDFIPVLGYLDDFIILPVLIALAIRLIPQGIMAESRIRARNEPLRLKRNWLIGGIFIAIWVILLVIIIVTVIKLFKTAKVI
jgi:uncharacterized membrane protein YkvA (DUF1232 family)